MDVGDPTILTPIARFENGHGTLNFWELDASTLDEDLGEKCAAYGNLKA